MTGFDAELRALARELSLPEPTRSRVLLELRSDLEDMAGALRERGVAEEEARRRALTTLLPDAAARSALAVVHRPLYQRVVDRFSVPGRHRLERGFLAVLAGLQLAVGAGLLVRLDLLRSPSSFLWPVLVLAALVPTAGVAKLLELYVVRSAGRDRLRRGVTLPLVLGGAAAVVAFGGLVVDLYGVAGRVEADVALQAVEVLGWLRRSAALLLVGVLAVSAGVLFWLAAAVRVARVERMEAMALGYQSTEGSNS